MNFFASWARWQDMKRYPISEMSLQKKLNNEHQTKQQLVSVELIFFFLHIEAGNCMNIAHNGILRQIKKNPIQIHIEFSQLNVYIAIELNCEYRIEWVSCVFVCVWVSVSVDLSVLTVNLLKSCYSHWIGFHFNMVSVNLVLQNINS